MRRRRSSFSSNPSTLFLAQIRRFISFIWQVVTKGLLRSLGFEVVRALSGNEALELLRTRNHLPDLILLDVEMPTESGYEVHYR